VGFGPFGSTALRRPPDASVTTGLGSIGEPDTAKSPCGCVRQGNDCPRSRCPTRWRDCPAKGGHTMRSVSRRHSSPLKRQSRSCPRESLLVWRFDEVKARPFPLLSSRLQDALLRTSTRHLHRSRKRQRSTARHPGKRTPDSTSTPGPPLTAEEGCSEATGARSVGRREQVAESERGHAHGDQAEE
jgi:hypothetical protein